MDQINVDGNDNVMVQDSLIECSPGMSTIMPVTPVMPIIKTNPNLMFYA
jgi:hypothetical protein